MLRISAAAAALTLLCLGSNAPAQDAYGQSSTSASPSNLRAAVGPQPTAKAQRHKKTKKGTAAKSKPQ